MIVAYSIGYRVLMCCRINAERIEIKYANNSEIPLNLMETGIRSLSLSMMRR